MLQLKYGESYDHARRFDIGVKIATAVDEALPLASKEIHDEIILAHKVDRIEVPRRIAKKEDYDNAGREVETNREKLKKLEAEGADALSREYSSAYRRVGFNEKIVELYKRQRRGEDKTLPVELHSLRIGDVAMCTNCFEYFLDFGLRIKCRVKALQTFIAQLTGEGTYLPTERGMKGGSYGAYIASTPIGPEGGRVIAEQQIKTVNGMFEK
jgi:hypothetical protein